MRLLEIKNFKINTIATVFQILITTIVYFLVYKIILIKLGLEIVGLWSVILATSSLTNLANFGISASVVRYVSVYSYKQDWKNVQKTISISLIIILILFLLIAGLIYPFNYLILSHILEPKFIQIGLELLPLSILNLIINAVGSVFGSVIEGLQMNYLKNIILIFSSIILLITSYVLINKIGILGVAYSQIIQSIFNLIIGFLLTVKLAKFNPLNFSFDKQIFKDIFKFGYKLQIINILGILLDPAVKIIMSNFGGLQVVGIFELASRIITQIRSVIVNLINNLLPFISINAQNKEVLNSLFKKSFNIIAIICVLVFTFLTIIAQWVSILIIGHKDIFFINAIYLLSIGYSFNLLSGTVYFIQIGKGQLRSIFYNHLILIIGVLILGIILGKIFAGNGVIFAWVITLIISSIYLINYFLKDMNINLKSLFNSTLRLLIFVMIAISLVNYLQNVFYVNIALFTNIIISLFFITIYSTFVILNLKKIKINF